MSEAGAPRAATPEREYRELVERMRALVAAHVPPAARVLVVTRGDEALLQVRGREAAHFPQSPTGMYAGHHPADGAEAVAELERLAAAGAEYLAIPATAVWWLDHYPELRTRLEEGGELVASDPATGVVYALAPRREEPRALTLDELEAMRAAPQAGALVRALLPAGAPLVLVGRSAHAVDVGERRCWRLPAPGPELPAGDVVAGAERARSAGARYLVVVEDDDPTRRLDGRVRARLARTARPLFAQRLVEGFELRERPGDG